ncbi:helix-turn-helix domain-containing protein [Pseudonocardia humida]|uniref:Helix-turn-helix transcriptional regulator n=1 Tax=Pseudonocardia humida TaxID=2800819 RepID=A0ABT0ZZA3_9PSEU|nr:AraC family transcriptional regulator [Pseudonocardia humida]MCO1656065.1 helix-turn-helix transcriptional regulator [Pseudonocardia humida]
MSYQEFPVRGRWAGLVEAAWTGSTPADDPGAVQPILPDGCMDIVWTGAELCVAGPDTAPHPHRRVPGRPACGLRFAPGRLPALLGVPAAGLRDRRVPLAELHPAIARATAGRLADADPDARTTLGVLADVVRALPATPLDPAVPALAALLGSAEVAGTSVAALADTVGWTPRTLHRHCLAAFGYGPAVLRRVLRFRRATDLLAAGVAPAEVAARAGYADQPHLSRELRALGGTSPRRFATATTATAAA